MSARLGRLRAAAIALPLVWSAPAFVDHQPPYDGSAPGAAPTQLSAVSCPTAAFCVAADAHGDILTSTDVRAGAGSWHITRVDNRVSLNLTAGIAALSCPSTSFCVAFDNRGDVLTSHDPGGGVASWHAVPVEPALVQRLTTPISALSCPTPSLCVAGDTAGNILTSTDPAAGASAWRSRRVDPTPGYFGISRVSCASRNFCAAVDGAGNVITSTHPTGDASAWTLRNVDGSSALRAVSCASRALCAAVDDTGVLVSTQPAGPASSWQRATLDQTTLGGLSAISCPSVSECVATHQLGTVFVSTDPAGGSSTWSSVSPEYISPFSSGIPGLQGLSAISCSSASFCVAVDSLGNAVSSTNPAGGTSAWTVAQIDGYNGPDGIACPASWCVAVDDVGNILTSGTPAAPSSWTATAVDRDVPPNAQAPTVLGRMSCASTSFCAAVDGDGNVLASRTPLRGPTWTTTTVDAGNQLSSIACPSAALCVAVDTAGNAVSATNPLGGPGAWTVSHIDSNVTSTGTQAALQDVSCPSAGLCVAADSAGNVLTTRHPTGGAAAWTPADVNGTSSLDTVACPSTSLCVAAGGQSVLTSRDPAGGVGAWSQTTSSHALSRLSCASATRCLGVGPGGDVIRSTDPASGGDTWRATHVDSYYVGAAACSPTGLCYALDDVGALLAGRPASLPELLGAPLHAALTPPRAARRIPALLSRGGYTFTFTTPVPGRLRLTWRASSGRVLVAAASGSFASAGKRRIRLALTPAGRRLLLHARRARMTATTTFSISAVLSISVGARLTLTG